jgi:inosose dehydratase
VSIRVANAPCSWGTIEGFFDTTPWDRMLDELAGSGYRGTELGDLGFMPQDPAVLRSELAKRSLVMLGGFQGVPLRHPDAVPAWRDRVLAVARLLAAVANEAVAGRRPYFILADETRGDPQRTASAGRVTEAEGLSADDMRTFAANASELARLVAGETGLATLFHHHCAAFIETPHEIERLLDATDPDLLGLVFDTGHYTYGTGVTDPLGGQGKGTSALDGLRRFWGRVPYVHLKDCHPTVAARARTEGWDYTTAVGAGVFCELGKGSVDLDGLLAFLAVQGYDDWLTVEQDVLPGMGTPRESAVRNRAALARLGL